MRTFKLIILVFIFAAFSFSCEREDAAVTVNSAKELVIESNSEEQQNKSDIPFFCASQNSNYGSFSSTYDCAMDRGWILDILPAGPAPASLAKIKVSLTSCGTFFNGPLNGQAYGDLFPPFARSLRFRGCTPTRDCNSGTGYNVSITYYFNNGCPPYTKSTYFPYN